MHIVDRRLNPKSKSLGNRQRFIRRARADIREAVKEALKNRKVSEIEGSEKVRIRAKSVHEPSFDFSRDEGKRDAVVPGNKKYQVGDLIPKPPAGGGSGGKKGSADGEGEDGFVFTLTKEEFLDMFFEDLALPNLEKTKLKDLKSPNPSRAGYSTDGPSAQLSLPRTMRNSLSRRIALGRPKAHAFRALEAELEAAESDGDEARAAVLREELERMRRRWRSIAYIDPLDLRYRRFEHVPRPTTQAVMFCLMDASASMTQALKDLAKRFFMLLYVFLSRHYEDVDVVFIRHTTMAQEVDEDTFFHSTETGGTVVSSALHEMIRVVSERYPVDDWNIYAAQASDGHNFIHDMPGCLSMLERQVIPLCQYFAYIEVDEHEGEQEESDSPLWSGYSKLTGQNGRFAMRRAGAPSHIYPVFHDLFAKSIRSKSRTAV